MSTEITRTAVIGLDGATYRLLDPLLEAGAMPNLARIRERGVSAVLTSTVPAYTPPAWTSMITGVNPGRHAIFGFLESTPQEPTRIAHSGTLRALPFWRYLNGVGAGVFNVPMTYPPVPVDGFLVSGGLAAGWTDPSMANVASDDRVAREIRAACGDEPYPIDTVVSYENDWSSDRIVEHARRVQAVRRRVLLALLETHDPSFLFAVFEGPDRLQHVHYQYLVECSDWYLRPGAERIRERAHAYFSELDGAIGELAAWAGSAGNVVLVSDHGAGPWEKTVNVNLLLAEWGYLRLPSVARVTSTRMVAGVGQRVARKILPRKLLLAAKAKINRSIDWTSARAFASQVAEQGIHVNEEHALPAGIVPEADVERLENEIVDRLAGLRDPEDGGGVVDRVERRKDVIWGPYERRAPHLFPICRDQRYELSDTTAAASVFTDHRDRPWGYHHNDGIFVAAGPAFAAGVGDGRLEIVDVLPTVFHAAGLPIPGDLDGRVATETMSDAARTRDRRLVSGPTGRAVDGRGQERDENPFSEEEQREIEESLRGLGYIE
jgi:predicted AlkP superfamily phosphohydrolase/phosphomutase